MPNPSKSNVISDKISRLPAIHGGKNGEEDEGGFSYNLWVGNLSNDVKDADLLNLFAKHGALDCFTTYSSRNYAFVYFKRVEDARAAKDALQGALLRGSSIKIEFARPAKPGKHLWVGGISSSVTKEQLEDEFLKFGKFEDFKFLRDRNSALIDFVRLEDASAALKNMNGRRLGGEQIRVDFLRSLASRRENWSDSNDSRDGHANSRRNMAPLQPFWIPDVMKNLPDSRQLQPSQHSIGRRGDGQASNVLWIGYPPSLQIDEQMLHNAMILFGEIERIKSFPSRHYSFVEFRSVDEARRAKEGLQGRLFSDPRIQILFSSSELAPPKDSSGFFNGIKGPRQDMLLNELPLGSGPIEFLGQNRPVAPNNFPGPLPPKGMPGPNLLMRPFGPQGGFDTHLSGSELFNDLPGPIHNFSENNTDSPMNKNWRRLSPSASGILPSPTLGVRPPVRHMPGTWDGTDTNPFQREPKRSRIDAPLPTEDTSFSARKIDNQGVGGESPYGFDYQHDRGGSVPLAQGQNHYSPIGARVRGRAPNRSLQDDDHCWRGIIAKGGTPVCQARCVPIGKGIDSQLPEIVNCSARTGLDMLTRHYAEAIGFEIAFFLPDSEDDFVSYTEFLRYLGSKDRAGVAKLDDGTTMFLVPPSDFLNKVLNFSGPERLYGVVLKMPQQMVGASIQHSQQSIPPPSLYIDRLHVTPQSDYNLPPPKEEQILQMDYNRALHEEKVSHPPKPLVRPSEEPSLVQSVPQDYATKSSSTPQAGVSLTPELIATLAALIPTKTQSSLSTNAQLPLASSGPRPASYPAVASDNAIPFQGWRQDHEANVSTSSHQSREEHAVNPSQQLGHPFNAQAQLLSQFPAYANFVNGPESSAQTTHGGSQIQDPSQNVLQQGASSSRASNNFGGPSQGVQFTAPQQANHPLQPDTSLNPQKSYGMGHATDGTGQTPVFQQAKPPVPQPAQVQGMSLSQTQLGMPSANDKVSTMFPNQVQQLQSTLSDIGQSSTGGEEDKNQRYQSTLQFAANLLFQIQQQQQQGSSQMAQGSGHN